jgi:hypothetical protein
MMLAHRFTIASSKRGQRLLLFIALGLVVAIAVDSTLCGVSGISCCHLPAVRGPRGPFVNILRFEFL